MFGLKFLAGWDRLHGAQPCECLEELVVGADEFDVETYPTSEEIFWSTSSIEDPTAGTGMACPRRRSALALSSRSSRQERLEVSALYTGGADLCIVDSPPPPGSAIVFGFDEVVP